MEVATGIFLSVFRTPFYGCFQNVNKNASLLMITMVGAKTPESSKICQTVVDFSYLVSSNTYSSEKKAVKLERLLGKGKSS